MKYFMLVMACSLTVAGAACAKDKAEKKEGGKKEHAAKEEKSEKKSGTPQYIRLGAGNTGFHYGYHYNQYSMHTASAKAEKKSEKSEKSEKHEKKMDKK